MRNSRCSGAKCSSRLPFWVCNIPDKAQTAMLLLPGTTQNATHLTATQRSRERGLAQIAQDANWLQGSLLRSTAIINSAMLNSTFDPSAVAGKANCRRKDFTKHNILYTNSTVCNAITNCSAPPVAQATHPTSCLEGISRCLLQCIGP